MSIIIVGILPAEETIWGRKSRVEQVNCLLKEFCSSHGFLFVKPAGCWRDSSGDINRSLYWKDGLWIIFNHIYNDIYDRKKRKKEKGILIIIKIVF